MLARIEVEYLSQVRTNQWQLQQEVEENLQKWLI